MAPTDLTKPKPWQQYTQAELLDWLRRDLQLDANTDLLSGSLQGAFTAQSLFTPARAYSGAAGAGISAGWTKVPLDTRTYDPLNNFDLANHQYVVPVAGVYLAIGAVAAILGAGTASVGAGIWKNNSIGITNGSLEGSIHESASTQVNAVVGGLIPCAAGDVLPLYCYLSVGTATMGGNADYIDMLSVIRVA